MKNIGLALGGGAVLGAAHVGVIKAIKEENLDINFISGTSIGAFVACLYAFGKGLNDIQKIGSELKWIDIAGLSLSRFALLSNEKLGALIEKHIGDRNIEDADIPLALVTTNASSGKKVVLTQGNVAKAVMASTAIPGTFEPIEVDDQLLVDGGVVENVPVSTLIEVGAQFTIGVDLNSNREYERPKNVLEVILNSFHFLMMQSSKLQTKDADLLITPDLSGFNRSDMSQIGSLMEVGYEAAKDRLRDLEKS